MSWNEGIDEAYASLVDNLVAFGDIPGVFEDPHHIQRLRVRRIEVETPIELDLRSSAGGVNALGSAPPLYRVETTIMPVFHTLRLTLVPAADLNLVEGPEP
jgi:hypothetical protein